MPLFTDQTPSTVDDLIRYEANLRGTVAPEGIELASKLELAQDEVGARLGALLLRPGVFVQPVDVNTPSTGTVGSIVGLGQVVVTTPLRLWHTFQSLTLVYRDLVGRKVNTSLEAKWTEYRRLSQWAQDLLCQSGIGLVGKPIPKAATPTLDWVSATATQMALYVSVTLVDGDGNEGLGSTPQALRVPDDNTLRVALSGTTPSGVVGFNIFAGTSPGSLTMQNVTVSPSGEAWIMPESGLVAGTAIGNGQDPEIHKIVPQQLDRG